MISSFFLVWLIINCLVGYGIGKQKDAVVSSILVCLLLGPIGWLLAMVWPGNVRVCPFCAENTRREANVCSLFRAMYLPRLGSIMSVVGVVWDNEAKVRQSVVTHSTSCALTRAVITPPPLTFAPSAPRTRACLRDRRIPSHREDFEEFSCPPHGNLANLTVPSRSSRNPTLTGN